MNEELVALFDDIGNDRQRVSARERLARLRDQVNKR